jgi:hypothetical protein
LKKRRRIKESDKDFDTQQYETLVKKQKVEESPVAVKKDEKEPDSPHTEVGGRDLINLLKKRK